MALGRNRNIYESAVVVSGRSLGSFRHGQRTVIFRRVTSGQGNADLQLYTLLFIY